VEVDAARDPPNGEARSFVMEQVSATRSELLARRARIVAAQGRDLLEERRSLLEAERDLNGLPINPWHGRIPPSSSKPGSRRSTDCTRWPAARSCRSSLAMGYLDSISRPGSHKARASAHPEGDSSSC
jgi:hypothetical protein